jgi:alkanesulfonate monooxygenase SsuD/methylene tetrahydromethanopterin reductase-like flavin-dependent oxidoreductase (luciferase family)
MKVGIGLPNAVPGTEPSLLIEWATRAEAADFSCVGVVDRVAYDCYEPMTALAAAAAATNRIGLASVVVIAPLRTTAILAKEAATIDALSGGRLTLGLSVGARAEDYAASGVDHRSRGARLSEQLVEPRSHWEDGLGPRPGRRGGPQLLVGGASDIAFHRMARHVDGYVHGGGPPRAFARAATTARLAWSDAGRSGEPLLWGQGYFALGDDVRDAGRAYMRDYYSFVGPFAERIAAGLLTTPQEIAQFVRGYAEAGCDELVLMPAIGNSEQVDRLADVLESTR